MKIVLKNLTKRFPARGKNASGDVIAVNDFNFEIPDGKLIGLLGPSGCGKSTALNLISGLLAPTSGRIFFEDDDVTFCNGLGKVFYTYFLFLYGAFRVNSESLEKRNDLLFNITF